MADKWLVIDSHTHHLPKEAVAKTGVKGGFDYKALINAEQSIAWRRMQNIEDTLSMMEGSGIDMAVINEANWCALGLEVCKALNDGYARINKEYPGKFIMCGSIPLEPGQWIVDEIDRCINVLGLKGIALVCSTPEVTLDSPELWAIYDKACKLDIPIVLHPSVRFPIWGGGKKYYMARTISREYDIIKATVEVMFGVLKDFPELKILSPHYGGGMPGLRARLEAWYDPEGWNIPAGIKACGKTPRELAETKIDKAFEELFNKIYFDTAGAGAGSTPIIKSALLNMRADRLCFGSDYAFDIREPKDMKAFIENIKGLDIPEKDKKLILGGNIKRLFKI